MGRKQNPRKIGNTDPALMETAINLVLNENNSVRTAAQVMNIPFQTLHRYVKKRRNNPECRLEPNYLHRLVFKADQEKILANYLITCSKMAYGLTVMETRKIAYKIAKKNHFNYHKSWDTNQMAGEDWRRAFVKRNKELSIRKPESCSLSRLTSFNKNNVDIFFNNLTSILEQNPKLADGSRIFNLDESGVQTVQVPKKIVAPKGVKQVYKCTSGERGETVTICAIVSAIGTFLPPVLVFPRKNFKNHMCNDAPSGTKGLANPSGWINGDLFKTVIDHFIEHTHSSKDNPTLLVYDNHESHISLEVVDRAREAGVHILTIPPHCSNKLQPLDISLFGPFKSYYNAACDKWMLQHPGAPLTIYEMAGRIAEAFEKSFTPSNIVAGFRKSGIHPFSPDVFTENDFLISSVTDRPLQQDGCQPDMTEQSNLESPSTSQGCTFEVAADVEKESLENRRLQINNPSTPPRNENIPNERKFISPEEIQPFPKALPRKQARKGRERGRSSIITSTPEKEKLIEKQNSKISVKVKDNMNELRDTKTNASQASKKKKIKRNKTQIESDTSEEDEDYEVLSENEDWIPEEESEETRICMENMKEGTFIVVKFPRNIYYVAQIMSIEEKDFMVSFLRKSSNNDCYFLFPREPDTSVITMEDVCMILPKPVPGTTKRQSNMVRFGIKFNSVNVR